MTREEAVRALVAGRVQGVGFRAFAARAARGLGLRGFVRNLPDGRVETVAAGAPEALARYVEALRSGPPAARVDAVETHPIDPGTATQAGFEQA